MAGRRSGAPGSARRRDSSGCYTWAPRRGRNRAGRFRLRPLLVVAPYNASSDVQAAASFAALAQRLDMVLVRPSQPGNVGAAARALRVMGLARLSLVAPREAGFASAPQALAFASGATDVLSSTRVHADVPLALADATLAIAVSAAGREFAAPPVTPEAAARLAFAELRADPEHRVAFLFGNERTGLSVTDAQRCQLLCSIPSDPGYGSLNLAQAVQVIAYCLRREWLDLLSAAPVPVEETPSRRGHAASGQVEAMLGHLEQALVAVDFLDPASPKRLMPRLRRLFARTHLTVEEVDILRGIAGAMLAAARARPQRMGVEGTGATERNQPTEPTTP